MEKRLGLHDRNLLHQDSPMGRALYYVRIEHPDNRISSKWHFTALALHGRKRGWRYVER